MGLTDRWEGGGFIRGVRKRWVRGQGGCKTRVGRGGWVMRGIFSHFSFHVLFSSLRYQCFSRNIPGPPDYRRDSGPEPQQQQGGRCPPLSSGRQNERCLSVLTPSKKPKKGSNAKMFLAHLAIPSRAETPVVFFLVVTVRPSSEVPAGYLASSSGGNIRVAGQSRSWGGGPISREKHILL